MFWNREIRAISIQSLKEEVWKHIKGAKTKKEARVDCPVCTRNVQRYEKNINKSIARALIHMAENKEVGEFAHYHDMEKESGNKGWFVRGFPTAAHFGLIKRESPDPTDSAARGTGRYAITAKGMEFVKEGIYIPNYVYMICGKVKGFSGDLVTIEQCLGRSFHYGKDVQGQQAMF